VVRIEATGDGDTNSPSVDDYDARIAAGWNTGDHHVQSPERNSETFEPVEAYCEATRSVPQGGSLTMEVSFDGGTTWYTFSPDGETISPASADVSDPPDIRWKATGSNPGEDITWEVTDVLIVTEAADAQTRVIHYVSTDDGSTWHKAPEWDPGLEAYWRLDGSADDVAGNGNDGTLKNDATLTADGPEGFGSALELPQSGTTEDYVSLDMAHSGAHSELTVLGWVHPTDLASQRIIVSFDRGDHYRFALRPSGQILLAFRDGNGNVQDLTSTGTVPTSEWTHVAAVFDGGAGEVRFYIDGELDATVGGQASTIGGGADRYGFIGTGSEATAFDGTTGPSDLWLGRLDDVQEWRAALTEDDVADLMRTPFQNRSLLLARFDDAEQTELALKVRLETDDTGLTPIVEDVTSIWDAHGYPGLGLGDVQSTAEALDWDAHHMKITNALEQLQQKTRARVRWRLDPATRTYLLDWNYDQTEWELDEGDTPVRMRTRATDRKRARVKVVG
jgi:hypothetical protein